MTAKLWPGDRCQEAGYPGESLCPACKRCPDNIKHRTYQCPVVKGQLPKRLCKGYLDREAVDLAADEPAKYLRGMASLKGLNIPQPYSNPGTWVTAEPLQAGIFFTDASGGAHPKDPRIRRVGWGCCRLRENQRDSWECAGCGNGRPA